MLQEQNSNGIINVELRAMLNTIIKRKYMIISGLLTIVILAAVVSIFILRPVYEAQVLLRVAHPFQLSENQKIDTQGLEGTVDIVSSLPVMTMQTHVSQLQSEALSKRVMEKLQLTETDLQGGTLFEVYDVGVIKDSNLIRLKARHYNPNLARDIVNTLSREYIKLIAEMSQAQMEESLVFFEKQYSLMQEKLDAALDKWNLLQSRREETLSNKEKALKISLETEIDHLKGTMKILAEKTAEIRIKGGIDFGQASILVVSAAETPIKPIKPNKLLNIVIAMLLGLIIIFPMAFIMELLDYRIRTSEDVERHLGLPVLGIIPDTGQKDPCDRMISSDAVAVEAYRVAQANLSFSDVSGACKSILFTSASQNVGKSTVVSNLAVALAQVGRKVLVVDCDLRKPSQHKIFGLDNLRGFTNYLVQKARLSECLQMVSDDLHVLTSGPIPPNPMEIISCLKIKQFWTLQQEYDYILVDAPPVLPVADALALVKQLDGAILIFDASSTPVGAAKEAKARLENVNGKIIGVFLNRVKIRRNEYLYGHYQ